MSSKLSHIKTSHIKSTANWTNFRRY